MKILIIDDNQDNLSAAREQLGEHELTVCSTIEEAWKILRRCGETWRGDVEKFDAVLTDLWMPQQRFESGFSMGSVQQGAQFPVGMVFAMTATNLGVPYVAILTDAHRHNDYGTSLLDLMDWQGDWNSIYGNGMMIKCEKRNFCTCDERGDCQNHVDKVHLKNWGLLLKKMIEHNNEKI